MDTDMTTPTHPTPLPAERPTAMFQCDGEYIIAYCAPDGREQQAAVTAHTWNVAWSENRQRIVYTDGNYYAFEAAQ